MPQQDTSQIKEKIISILKTKGPSLPIHIAKEINLSLLFTSAFLSELIAEKRIKTSHMKIGNSPLYLIPGQENLLEKYSNYLKSKEKEAFILLKEKGILKDSELEPAIKVAIRAIKDFAIPLNENGQIYWRYINFKENKEDKIKKSTNQINQKPKIQKPKKTNKNKTQKKSSNKSSKFLEKIKEYLSNQQIEITNIESLNQNELFLIIKQNNEQKLLAAFNKKRIIEEDLLKANKKAEELNMKYVILSLGEPLKKITKMINAIRNLEEIEKIQ